MTVQVFIDDSGGKGHSKNFVLAGLIAESEAWAHFSEEWRACLAKSPTVSLFKMREAAKPKGKFGRFSEQERDEKLTALARIINQYAERVIYAMYNLDDHAKTFAAVAEKPFSEAYFIAFQSIIIGACHDLWDHGLRQPFEVIFDEQVMLGPRAKVWYPMVLAIMQEQYPEAASIMPLEPMFKTDDEFLPIQAADLFAWCFRRGTDNPGEESFAWLLDELKSVIQSEYCHFYDEERMQKVLKQGDEMISTGKIPRSIVEKCNEILGA